MSDKALRYIIAAVITFLLVFQIGHLIAGLFGMVWGALSAVAVGAVSFLSARLAKPGVKSSFWFPLPALVFTVIPIGFMVWKAMRSDARWFDLVAELTPFVIGFGAPIILLLIAYFELRRRTLKD